MRTLTRAFSSSKNWTDLVEAAVLDEFERISERGGVLGAMETGYQRAKIQEESFLLRAQEARRKLSNRRRQHVCQPARRHVADAGTGTLDRGGKSEARSAGLPNSKSAMPPQHPR